jgi:hypothetical protein
MKTVFGSHIVISGGEEEFIWDNGEKGRSKETTRKTKM